MKRILDVVLAVVGAVVGAPLIALIALLVRLDSPGRVIFSQPRLGQGGRVFHVHKFRKFPGNWGKQGPGVTVANDARMTRFGRFLERSKLDELPQLWNIVRGEMSFVGPRPESLRYRDLFQGELTQVLEFVPGIFGPNQVAFRNESEMYPPDRDPEEFYREELFLRKARNDIEYFSRANLLSDMAWIVRGLWYSFAGAVNWGRLAALHGRILVLDLLVIETAWIAANGVRFAGAPTGNHLAAYITGTWLLPLVLIPILMLTGCYRQPTRHFSAGAALRLAAAATVGWIVAELVLLGLFHRNTSIALGPIGLVFTLAMMTLPRIAYRERWRRRAGQGRNGSATRIAVYGAGRRGAHLVPLLDQGFPDTEIIGLIDDNDAEMRGREIAGVKVLGSERDLATIQAVHRMHQLWTTFLPDIHKQCRLQKWCEENSVKLVVLPLSGPFATLSALAVEPEYETPDPVPKASLATTRHSQPI